MKNDKTIKTNKKNADGTIDDNPANRDPLTGAPGAHPVGTGVGAAAGGATGAAIGAVGGPVGAAIGLVAGSVIGGLAGKAAGEGVNPTEEDTYWRETHRTQTYANNRPYDEFAGAYRTGYEGYSKYGSTGRTFEDSEADLRADYDRHRGQSRLSWEEAKEATRSAWHRLSNKARNVTRGARTDETATPRYDTDACNTNRPQNVRYEPKERSKP
jgi:uncharacterized protein YcfJ